MLHFNNRKITGISFLLAKYILIDDSLSFKFSHKPNKRQIKSLHQIEVNFYYEQQLQVLYLS